MMEWIALNKEWLFSGIGIAVLGWIAKTLFNKRGQPPEGPSNITNINIANTQGTVSTDKNTPPKSLDFRNNTRILFVDDDTKFPVTKILKTAGWPHVKIIKDISSLISPDLQEADILFIDIQGVGKALSFSDEGLGLAEAIKNKYPKKKIIIYSSQSTGDRFHRGLQKADYFLAKNADPYEFIKLVEEFSGESS
jgi:hypothetical protein